MENISCSVEVRTTLGKGSSFWNTSNKRRNNSIHVVQDVNYNIIIVVSISNSVFSNSSTLVLWN